MELEADEATQDDDLEETESDLEASPADAAEPTAPHKRRWWLFWTIVFLVLALAVVGLGWYASDLRDQVAGLKADIDAVQQQAGTQQTAASAVANELMPLAEEHVLVAKLRQAAGNPDGAAGSLHQAKRLAEMARRLAPVGGPAKLGEIEQLIGEVETAMGKREPAEPQQVEEEEPVAEPVESEAAQAEVAAPDEPVAEDQPSEASPAEPAPPD